METQAELLAQAVRLASANADAGQLPFGALVVRDGTVLATGVNTALRDVDPTAHAEIEAIRAACRALDVQHLTGATIVSSCEPCAICHVVAASVGIVRILYAARKEDLPELGSSDPHLVDVARSLQSTMRSTFPDQIVHAPTPGALEPFDRYLRYLSGPAAPAGQQ